ncbi:hypothetical protein NDN08_004348 [Rhodosorus marinus]|uniref:Reverse transcriptase RNase H-like domain-containing protein n=1 Tax=Rhodosorus marinus TaxID=101924 RepID=A0AAV8UNS7_9RHOD|nr:hypothetical protein NDN08_004348 [Rhodosorus marinus]
MPAKSELVWFYCRRGRATEALTFCVRKFKAAEQRYTVSEKECLAVVFGLRKFRTYVLGEKLKIISDHEALKWLMSLREPRGRLLRWMLDIQEYDFQMEHRSGVSPIMASADALSRVYDLEGGDTHGESVAVVVDGDPGWDLPDDVEMKTEQMQDLGDLEKFVNDQDGKYAINEGLVVRIVNGVPLVYAPENLRSGILRHFHGAPACGHLGVARTLSKLRRHFWWDNGE